MGLFNATCPSSNTAEEDPTSFFEAGTLNFDAHRVGWAFSGICAMVATIVSFFLVWKHCEYYTKPNQQRYIIRTLLMVPIYAVVSWLSYRFYRQSIYYETVRDCYEAFVIASFFILLLQYIGDTTESQGARLATKKPRKLVFPLNCWMFNPASPHFLMVLKWGILQYVIVRPIMTILAMVMETEEIYCERSMSPAFGHLYVLFFNFTSVTIAMYCLVLFYIVMKTELKPFDPFYKFLCVKLVIFFSFWQYFILSILVHFNVIKDTQYWTSANVSTGVAAILTCLEMVVFAFLHVRAFGYRVYRPVDRKRTKIFPALIDSLNPIDTLREIGYGLKYIYRLIIGQPVGPGNRLLDLEMALDKRRPIPGTGLPSYMIRSDSLAHFQHRQPAEAVNGADGQDPDELMMENLRKPAGKPSGGAKGDPSPRSPPAWQRREGSDGGSVDYPSSTGASLTPNIQRPPDKPDPLALPSSSPSSTYTAYQYRPEQQQATPAIQAPRVATNPSQRAYASASGDRQDPASVPLDQSAPTSDWGVESSHASMPPEMSMEYGGYDYDGVRAPPRAGHGQQSSQGPSGGKYNFHVYD